MTTRLDPEHETYDLPTFPLRPGQSTVHSFKFVKTYRLTELKNIPKGIVIEKVDIGTLPKSPSRSWTRSSVEHRDYASARILSEAGESLYIYVKNESVEDAYTGGQMVLMVDEVPGAPPKAPPRFIEEDEGTSEFANKLRELVGAAKEKTK